MNPYIQQLKAKRLSLFNTLKVNFTPGLNVLIGPNASGKTTILRAITYCFNGDAITNLKYFSDTSFSIKICEGDSSYEAGFESMGKGNEIYQVSGNTVWATNLPQPSYRASIGKVPYNLLAIGANRYFDYINIQGTKKEPVREQAKREYDSNNSKYIDKPALPSIKQWMINRYFIQNMEWAKLENLNWKEVISSLYLLAPDEEYDFRFVDIQRDHEPKFILNGNTCYLEELSSGFKSVLSIVFSIVQWIEEVNEGDRRLIKNATGTVLIDEIDVHLHPSWQTKILKSLQEIFPNLQFIVTTHSPLVMSTIKNSDKDSIQKIVNDGKGNYWCEKITTYGEDATYIIQNAMASIPRDSVTEKKLKELFRLIDNDQLEEAIKTIRDLKKEYGNLSDIYKAESMVEFLTD